MNNNLETLPTLKLHHLEQDATPLLNGATLFYRCLNTMDWDSIYLTGQSDKILECESADIIKNKISIGKLIMENEREIVWSIVQDAIKNRAPYQLIYRIKTPADRIKILFEQGQGVYSDDKLIELCGFITDITTMTNGVISDSINNYMKLLADELIAIAYKEKGNVSCHLSNREIEVLISVCKGMTMKEIGMSLSLSPRTIEMHINNIRLKLNCHNKSELRKLFFKTTMGKRCLALA